MWWAASVAKQEQVIQDRWCAICRKMVMHLMRDLWVRLQVTPTQMAIPLHKECNFLKQLVAAMWRVGRLGTQGIGLKTHLIGVDLES